MKFSTKTTYGLRAMIRLAKAGETTSLKLIADKEGISLKYLERLVSALKKEGLLNAEKGTSGGYKLAKRPDEISVYDIVKALEGTLSPFHCLDEEGKVFCSSQCDCAVVPVLAKVQKAVADTLKGIKLHNLL